MTQGLELDGLEALFQHKLFFLFQDSWINYICSWTNWTSIFKMQAKGETSSGNINREK